MLKVALTLLPHPPSDRYDAKGREKKNKDKSVMEERAVMTDDVRRGLLGLLTQLCIVYHAAAAAATGPPWGIFIHASLEPSTHPPHRSRSKLVTT